MQPTPQIALFSGFPAPLGVSFIDGKVNFAVYAKDAPRVLLYLFQEEQPEKPYLVVELLSDSHKTGWIWHASIQGILPDTLYGYEVIKNKEGVKKETHILLDPYAKALYSPKHWNGYTAYRPLGKILFPTSFDWEGVPKPKTPLERLIIYEAHIRGFTQDKSSKIAASGTYTGLIDKIPYLLDLGINAVELMPIFEFNEREVDLFNPATGEKLCNYFGYSPVTFFSPMNRFAFSSEGGGAVREFKTMVRELHRHGIEVLLDVVYNHTAEGNENGPTLSFKGFHRDTYYLLDEKSRDFNFSGCGNTCRCNHPVMQQLILDSLRYWATEMQIDGFRFDLASILTRGDRGTPSIPAPIIEMIAYDPILADTKLIAEAWDAAGLYQVGGFYPTSRWLEWNGKYRDTVRQFIKGTARFKSAFATALSGSEDLFGWRGSPSCSINFVTAHDGFSLADLVTYNQKHNEENGENNRDGTDHNISWNCGIEGHSANKKIVALRERQIRNFHLALMVSQGIPMLVMGDEYAHTRDGNNNPWCQDNTLNWFQWDAFEKQPGFYRFYRNLVHFRKMHASFFMRTKFLRDHDVSWHGVTPFHPEWEKDNHFVAFTLNDTLGEPQLYIAFNSDHTTVNAAIPKLEAQKVWKWVVDTYNTSPEDFLEEGARKEVDSHSVRVQAYSSIVLKVYTREA